MGSNAPIADYALIGDCHGAALVRRDGTIDWACVRRFDSGALFAGLLDPARGGRCAIVPRDLRGVSRRYLDDTNVLETTFRTGSGTARLLDCFTMRRGGRKHPFRQLLRVVEGLRGEVCFDVIVEPRFDYASLSPWLRWHPEHRVFTGVGGDDAFVLISDAALSIDRAAGVLSGTIDVRAGQRSRLSLVAYPPHEMSLTRLSAEELDQRLDTTIEWWRRWIARGHYEGEFGDVTKRSSLVLKLLTCAPTGAIIAAPTTSLPESIGGSRNWDYRYAWVRDATMTLAALLAVGQPEAATGFKHFIERSTAGRVDGLQIMYGCYGERHVREEALESLTGYRGSRPVRRGNAAAAQFQLDVYGELLDAAHLWETIGHRITGDGWEFLRSVIDETCRRWREPDQGMWESRGDPLHHVYSKVMCWVALERGIQAARAGLRCDLERWRTEQAMIRESVMTHGFDASRGCFVQAYGSKEVDASLLRLPMVGFIQAKDPRMVATVKAIQEDLGRGRLLARYRNENTDDGVEGGEGAFLMTSFWMADVLAMQGQIDRADALFRSLLGLANDVGLYSEEYDPDSGLMLGNFPQAFTHVALISTARQLSTIEGEARELVSERAIAKTRATGGTSHHHERDSQS